MVADTISEPVRRWALPRIARGRADRARIARGEQAPPPSGLRAALVTLLTCHWCASVWIAAAVTAAAWASGGHWAFTAPCAALAIAYLVGFVADHERE